jgi:sec-independent protein translocase protein TatC
MSLVEHLEELRRRLVISLIALTVGAVAGLILYPRVLNFLVGPYRDALRSLPAEARPPGSFSEALVFNQVTEPFLQFLKVGIFTGFLIALPVILYQLWAFVTPGLTSRERRLSIPFVLSSLILFGGGVAFAFVVTPRGLSFLLGFGGNDLIPLVTIQHYLNFLIFLILAFGISFEFPLVLIFLSGARIITTAQMRAWRLYAYFGAIIFAAVITPTQDPYTMVLMWIPLVLLYEGAILIARLFKR